MDENQSPGSSPPRNSRIRWSLSFLLVLVTVVACVFGYISYHRQRGTDRMVADLRATGATYEQVLERGDPVEENAHSWIDRQCERLFGNTEASVREIRFDLSIASDHVLLDARAANSLQRSLATNRITTIRFRDATISRDASLFFSQWPKLQYLEIRDTQLPEKWCDALKDLKQVKRIVISGAMCNLKAESMVGCKSLEYLWLAGRGTNTTQLTRLRKLLPHVNVQVFGGFDQPWTLPAGQTYSLHNPAAHAEMKGVLDRLHSTLAGLQPPATNRFNSPASIEQISRLEHRIGVPLHPTLRALLEIHNGQPKRDDELVVFEKLLTVDEIIENYDMWVTTAFEEWKTQYEFDVDFNEPWNPDLVVFGTSEDQNIAINMINGEVYDFTSETQTERVLGKLSSYFEAIMDELEAGRYEPHFQTPANDILLTDYSLDVWKRRREKEKRNAEP